jgi:hypothetical protein
MMAETPHPQLLHAVLERDKEREKRIKFQRIALGLKLQNQRLQRQVQRLTIDRTNLSHAVTRAKRA